MLLFDLLGLWCALSVGLGYSGFGCGVCCDVCVSSGCVDCGFCLVSLVLDLVVSMPDWV